MSMTTMTAADRYELRSVIARFLQKVSSEGEVWRMIDSPEGFDRTVWRRMATELGIQGLAVPERLGGSGLGWREIGQVFSEAGRTLFCAPLLATIVADAALEACSTPANADEIDSRRAEIAAGSLIASFALGTRGADNTIESPVQAQHRQGRIQLSGQCGPIIDAGAADLIVVGARDDAGYGMYAIETSAQGIMIQPLQSLDLTRRLFRLELRDAPARRLATGEAAVAAAQRALDLTGVVLASEQLGAMSYLLEATVEYTLQRHQFCRPIGSFQSVKHCCADMLVDVEMARAAVEYALGTVDGPDLPTMSALVQAQVTEAGSRVAGLALQLHGAIAYTWEHMIHLYLRRAKTTEILFGSPALHRERLVSLIGL